ncbi:MAG: HTTM domain-containing protein [Pirellulales bacterium]
MSEPASLRSAFGALKRFFFAPQDTLACDVVRIGYAGVLLCMSLLAWPQARVWFGETGALPYEISRSVAGSPGWTVFTLLPHTDLTAYVCLALLILQAGLLLLGVWSRFQAVCLYGWLLSFHNRNPLILDSEDALLRVLGFLVIWMPLGHTLSLGAWRRGRLASLVERPVWALRLLQIETCLVFAGSALSKLQSDDWVDGTAMYYVSRLDDLFGRFPTPAFVWESLFWMKLLTWAVIAIEAAVPVLVWFRETRWFALAAAVLMHLGIDYTMNLFAFHWIMLVAWSSFVRGEDWRALAARLRGSKNVGSDRSD